MVSHMRVVSIPCLSDNYAYLVIDGTQTAIVDPSEAPPVLAAIEREGVTPAAFVDDRASIRRMSEDRDAHATSGAQRRRGDRVAAGFVLRVQGFDADAEVLGEGVVAEVRQRFRLDRIERGSTLRQAALVRAVAGGGLGEGLDVRRGRLRLAGRGRARARASCRNRGPSFAGDDERSDRDEKKG